MKHSATSSDAHARASWPLSEPTLAYFPNARFTRSDRDLGAGVASNQTRGGVAVSDADFGHVPVLADRCLELLTPALTRHHPDGSGAVLVDATIGAGGHTERFLSELPGLRLIGLDRDHSALEIAGARLQRFAGRVTLVHTRYDGLADALAESGYGAGESVDGVLFDLGVSSMQLDRAERGFAYAQDAPLDMRMDPESPLTAAVIVNTYDEAALADILYRYGEEKFARRIAAHIVRQRARAPFTSTAELVAVLYQAIPAPARRTGGHPAKRTFQALRIAVNDELDTLRRAVPAALHALVLAGRIVVLAYQSLEDRIVKRVFADAVASRTPAGLPVELPGHGPRFRSLTRGAERADAAEIGRNPRSAPVRLRALQRVGKGDA
jgi:16S rRNA (cytosine1402-N4)-methyltransferase